MYEGIGERPGKHKEGHGGKEALGLQATPVGCISEVLFVHTEIHTKVAAVMEMKE